MAALAFHVEELLHCDKNHLTGKPKIFIAWPFTGKMCQLLTWGQSGTLPASVEDMGSLRDQRQEACQYQLLLL